MAKGTIEVDVYRHDDGTIRFRLTGAGTVYYAKAYNLKPLDDDARKMLEPGREWLQKKAIRFHYIEFPDTCWDGETQEYKDERYKQVREVAKMIAEKLREADQHGDWQWVADEAAKYEATALA